MSGKEEELKLSLRLEYLDEKVIPQEERVTQSWGAEQ